MTHVLDGAGLSASPFPPIADYGFLSDCQTCALVAPGGSVEWLCLPRFDSPSVFGAILDRGAGMFRLGPDGVAVPAARRYLPGTMVLETSWGAPGGWIIVRDALLIGPWHHEDERAYTRRRAPTDYGDFPDHPWRAFLQRSALTLKGLSYEPTGALVAAATTSLPEAPGGERNWDYRYAWIRDATFMLWGLYTLGFDREANDFFYFLAELAEAEEGRLQIMYGIGGEAELPERTLDHLSGYEDARPVRVGNDAYKQDQHDVWGAILDSFYLHTKTRDELPERIWPILVKQVESALTSWREPDRGIWEIRGEPKHFTSSKLMCWVAADRGARLAEIRGELEHAARWQSSADEIGTDICAHALDDRGVFCQHYGTTAL